MASFTSVSILYGPQLVSSLHVLELNVDVEVSYTPPPGFTPGPNEYRAASGPVNITCTAIGGAGAIQYQWSSTCRDCPFQSSKAESNSSLIMRAAVHSGDSGVHTCTVSDEDNNMGNRSIFFKIISKWTVWTIRLITAAVNLKYNHVI